MATSTVQANHIPAYASFTSFKTFLDWLQEMDQVPAQIDRSLWGTKFNGATGSALITSGRFLGLLIEERPTPRLHELARADTEARKNLIEQMLRSAYGDDIVGRLPEMTPKMLDVKLRELGATDGTLRKAASFFINALKTTDVQVPSAIARKARNRTTKANRRGSPRSAQESATVNSSDSQPPEMSSIASSDGRSQFFQGTRKLGEDPLGNDVVATLTISGPFLNMANIVEKLDWFKSIVKAFDEGAAESEEEEDATDS